MHGLAVSTAYQYGYLKRVEIYVDCVCAHACVHRASVWVRLFVLADKLYYVREHVCVYVRQCVGVRSHEFCVCLRSYVSMCSETGFVPGHCLTANRRSVRDRLLQNQPSRLCLPENICCDIASAAESDFTASVVRPTLFDSCAYRALSPIKLTKTLGLLRNVG